MRIVVVDAVVIRARHAEIRHIGLAAVFPCLQVVDLALICRIVALGPRADGVFRARHEPLLLRGMPRGAIQVYRSLIRMNEGDEPAFSQALFYQLGAADFGSISQPQRDFLASTA